MAFGRLPRSPAARPFADINVTPLVDVMLVLVVVLILAAPLLASSIRLQLPASAAGRGGAEPVTLRLAIDAAGQVFVDDLPVQAEALAAHLQARARAAPDAELQLRADRGVAYGRVVEVIGMAEQAGLRRVAFATVPAPPAAAR